MKIWHISTDPNTYRSLVTPDLSPGDYTALVRLFRSGQLFAATWKPLRVEWFIEKEEDRKPVGDFPTIAGIVPLIMSEKARTKLTDVIQENVEFLPLEASFGIYYAANVHVVDCLEREKSQLIRFSDGGIMRVERYAFNTDILKGMHIFRIPEEVLSRTFVDEDFKSAAEEHGLKGLTFHEVPFV